jgi:signal peptidase I
MLSTYKPGDKLFCIKRINELHINDVIVVEHNNKHIIKRCLGLPGDTLLIENGKFYVNNSFIAPCSTALEKKENDYNILKLIDIFNTFGENWTPLNIGPYIIPRKGMRVTLTDSNRNHYKSLFQVDRQNSEYKSRDSLIYTFQNDYVFIVGDNREVSIDSRFFGPIKKSTIRGKILFAF